MSLKDGAPKKPTNVLFQWDDAAFGVGDPTIDEQHKMLVKMINDLDAAMRAGATTKDDVVLLGLFDGLVAYTFFHFDTELVLMQNGKYPGMDDHLKQHEFFVSKIAQAQEDFQNGKVNVSTELLNFLVEWLKNHIQKTDKVTFKKP
jgi:hemerythrin-like metal-binding protein